MPDEAVGQDPQSPRATIASASVASAWSSVAWHGGEGRVSCSEEQSACAATRASATRSGTAASVPVEIHESPAPAARPDVPETPSVWDEVDAMEADDLGALLLQHEVSLPSAHLQKVCSRIETLTSQKRL